MTWSRVRTHRTWIEHSVKTNVPLSSFSFMKQKSGEIIQLFNFVPSLGLDVLSHKLETATNVTGRSFFPFILDSNKKIFDQVHLGNLSGMIHISWKWKNQLSLPLCQPQGVNVVIEQISFLFNTSSLLIAYKIGMKRRKHSFKRFKPVVPNSTHPLSLSTNSDAHIYHMANSYHSSSIIICITIMTTLPF